MASVQDCERALLSLTDRYASLDVDTRTRHAVQRTLRWHVTDLAVAFSVTVSGGEMSQLRCVDALTGQDHAQVRLTSSSEDLLALADGSLAPATAWAHGRLKVEASVLDLLRLRSWI